jgi:AraC-like DNA-binding protein
MSTRFSLQITNRPREPENNVNTVVLEYIEKNFCQNDICLSKIAEELSLSANLISRIVKEAFPPQLFRVYHL